MINLHLTDDQTNLMAHIIGEMPYKHAAPLMQALQEAVARSRQPAPQFESTPRFTPPAGAGLPAAAVNPETGESYADLTPPPRRNPPPRGMKVAKD